MDYAPLKNMASLWRAGNDAPGGLPDLCWCQFHLCPCSKANLRFKRYSIFFSFIDPVRQGTILASCTYLVIHLYIYIYICICPMRFIYVSVLWDTETYSRDIPFTKAKIHIFSWMSPRCVFSLYVSHSFMMFHGFSGHVRMKNGPIQWSYPHTALRPHT